MHTSQRIALILPDARLASRANQVHRFIPPLLNEVRAEMPLDEPVPIRCAWIEREVLRRAPLGMCFGELLAGRLDPSAEPCEAPPVELPPDMYPHGQRAHTALDAAKLLRLGISGVESEIRERMASAADDDTRTFYRSTLISLEGFSDLVSRLREMARDLSRCASEDCRHREMAELAEMLSRVPSQPAATFREALQAVHLLYFAVSLTVQSLYGPGRIDRILWPYYKADLDQGLITRDEALQLICCQFMLMNYLYQLPQPVMIGGLGVEGRDTTNELTYLCLEADSLLRLVNPSLAIGVNEQTPDDLLDIAAQSLLSGLTKPALFNDRVIIEGLGRLDVTPEDAVEYIHSTCVEITVIGRSNILVASPYMNLLTPLLALIEEGASESFDALLAEYKRRTASVIADAAASQREIRKGRVEGWAFPLASCFTSDSIERGIDMDRGGARYTWVETSNVGLANAVDSLMVIKRRVYEDRSHTLADIHSALCSDFPDESSRATLTRGVPRYGNDDPEADSLAREIVETIYAEHYKHRDYTGGWFVPGFFCWIMHRILGEQTPASPDGRRSGEPLANAAGAAQGRDRSGPTAAIRSITSWPHEPGIGGIVLNLRFSPDSFADSASRRSLVDLVRTYFDLGGFEVQINAVDTATLRDAQAHPEAHADLLVRVAGYSDYFTSLDPRMQEEVIGRSEHLI